MEQINKRLIYIFFFIITFVFIITSFFIAKTLLFYTYDSILENYITEQTYLIALWLPMMLLYIIVVLFLRTFLDRFHFLGKSIIRHRLMMTFFLVTLVSFTFYIFIFQVIFGQFIITHNSQNISFLKEELSEYRRQINIFLLEKQEKLQQEINQNSKDRYFDNYFLYNYSTGGITKDIRTKLQVEILSFFSDISPNNDKLSTSETYSYYIPDKQTFIVGIKIDQSTYLMAYKEVRNQDFLKRIVQVRAILAGSINYEILNPLILKLAIIIYLYLYLPIFVLGGFIYYLISNQFFIRIRELNNFGFLINKRLLGGKFQKEGNQDELSEIVLMFKKMLWEIMRRRRRVQNIQEYKVWKEASLKIAHEIKNPITPILLASNFIEEKVMKKDMKLYSELHSSFSTVKERIEFMKQQIKDFSNFYLKPAHLKTINIHTLLKKINKLMSPFSMLLGIEAKYKALNNFDGKVEVDIGKIEQVFSNLFQNAIENFGEEDSKKELFFIASSKEDKLILTVFNNGKIIPEENQNKIFNEQFTTKSNGMGLGLGIVKQIIEEHKGKIYFKSDKESGTQFIIELPMIR